MPVVPALSIFSAPGKDRDGNPVTDIFPTVRSPTHYEKKGYLFWSVEEAHFYNTFESSVAFQIFGKPLPQKRGFLRRANYVVSSKPAQNELASVIENLFLVKMGGSLPTWFHGDVCVSVNVKYIYPDPRNEHIRPNSAKYADVDNLQKFVLDALQKSGLLGNDRSVTKSTHEKIIAKPQVPLTLDFLNTGGYCIRIKKK